MKKYATAGLTIMAAGSVSPVLASDENRQWQYEITPYLLVSGMEGTAGVRGYSTDLDASFSDIIDNLDMGFMGLFTAKKGRWSFGLEGIYIDLNNDTTSPVTGPAGFVSGSGKLNVSSSMYIAQGTVKYRAIEGNTMLDGFGALRYSKLDLDMDVVLQFDEPKPFDGADREGGSENWVDAVVGAHVLHAVSDNVVLLGYLDIGAGGSDLTYQLMAGMNWEFTEDYIAKLGYRYLYWDYEDVVLCGI